MRSSFVKKSISVNKIVDIPILKLELFRTRRRQNSHDQSEFRTFPRKTGGKREAIPLNGPAKVDSGFDRAASFRSFACGAWTSAGATRGPCSAIDTKSCLTADRNERAITAVTMAAQ